MARIRRLAVDPFGVAGLDLAAQARPARIAAMNAQLDSLPAPDPAAPFPVWASAFERRNTIKSRLDELSLFDHAEAQIRSAVLRVIAGTSPGGQP